MPTSNNAETMARRGAPVLRRPHESMTAAIGTDIVASKYHTCMIPNEPNRPAARPAPDAVTAATTIVSAATATEETPKSRRRPIQYPTPPAATPTRTPTNNRNVLRLTARVSTNSRFTSRLAGGASTPATKPRGPKATRTILVSGVLVGRFRS